MESIRSYRVFDSRILRFREKNETKRIIGSKNKVVFDKSGTFFILMGTPVRRFVRTDSYCCTFPVGSYKFVRRYYSSVSQQHSGSVEGTLGTL